MSTKTVECSTRSDRKRREYFEGCEWAKYRRGNVLQYKKIETYKEKREYGKQIVKQSHITIYIERERDYEFYCTEHIL